MFHSCMTAPDNGESLRRILDPGGKRMSRSRQRNPNDLSKRMVFCTGSLGTVIELYTHSLSGTYENCR